MEKVITLEEALKRMKDYILENLMFGGFLFMTIECLRSVHSIVYKKNFCGYNKHDI